MSSTSHMCLNLVSLPSSGMEIRLPMANNPE